LREEGAPDEFNAVADQSGAIVRIGHPPHPAANTVRTVTVERDIDPGARRDPLGKKDHGSGSADVRGLTLHGRGVYPADMTLDGSRHGEAVRIPLL
jgi:hypothetical protein